MKILLNGATSGTNFGDFLFARMFQDKVSEIAGSENVFWYKSRYALSDFYTKHLKYNNHYSLKHISALVYISGGYFHGDDHTIKDYIIRYLRYFHIGILCIMRGIPLAIVAVEVGATKSWWIRKVESLILRKSNLTIVRNYDSFDYASRLIGGGGNIITTADSVFAMERSLFDTKTLPPEIIDLKSKNKLLFLHINPSINGNKEIIDKIVPIINEFCLMHPQYSLVIGMDQYAINEAEVFSSFGKHIKVQHVFNKYDDPFDLCKVLDSCDIIVTHKLHVGIVGAYLGKSVISFSGHTSKIERLYKQLNILERTTPLSSLTLNRGLQILEDNFDKPIRIPTEITVSAKSNFKFLTNFLEQLKY